MAPLLRWAQEIHHSEAMNNAFGSNKQLEMLHNRLTSSAGDSGGSTWQPAAVRNIWQSSYYQYKWCSGPRRAVCNCLTLKLPACHPNHSLRFLDGVMLLFTVLYIGSWHVLQHGVYMLFWASIGHCSSQRAGWESLNKCSEEFTTILSRWPRELSKER